MDELATGATAVDPPLVCSVPGTRVRRHRRVTGLSGILLFACLFLPAVDACGAVRPYELPPLLPPYLYGGVFALIAIGGTQRWVIRGAVALRVLAALVAIAGAVLLLVIPELGVPELVLGVVLLLIIGLSRTTELQIAASAILIAVVSLGWFGLWCLDDGALLGVYLSLASSAGLCLGGVLWWRELAVRPAVAVPPAVARRRE